MTASGEVRDWWADHPMTYGAGHGDTRYAEGDVTFGSRAFFDRLDEEFYSWNRPLHDARPFGKIFPYDAYGAGAKVLEIGCGMGTMAMNWARAGAQLTAVDLNDTAVEQTRARFDLHGLDGDIRSADARALEFADGHFDYVYSWGVLHHSPDIERSIAELLRVLKPGGGFGLMLYNRHSILHAYMTRYVEGFLHRENEFLSHRELASRYGDDQRGEGNPHTWPVTAGEMRRLLQPHCADLQVRRLGTELDSVFKFLLPGLGLVLPIWAKKVWARRFGWSLWLAGHKA